MKNQENGFWECRGNENNRHILQIMPLDQNECRECGKQRPAQTTQINQPQQQPGDGANGLDSINNNEENRTNTPISSGNNQINTNPQPRETFGGTNRTNTPISPGNNQINTNSKPIETFGGTNRNNTPISPGNNQINTNPKTREPDGRINRTNTPISPGNNQINTNPKPREPDGGKNASYSTNNNGNNGSIEPKPKQDIKLFIALVILNIVSGYTTINGVKKIFSNQYIGWFGGATIQALLLLLTSGSTLKHAPWLKWITVGSFSIISVYTSFFAYYDNLVAETRKKDGLKQARDAHYALVNKVFIPIEKKAQQLENKIQSKEAEIKREKEGKGSTATVGEGLKFQQLTKEKNELQAIFDQVKPVADKYRPLFNYDLEGKKPEEIFNKDLYAISQVESKCLPTEPEFVCVPEEYDGVFNDKDPKSKEDFERKYIDGDTGIRIIEPFLKIGKGEPAAIGAAFIALLVDGCIILLGIGIEIPPKSKKTTKTIILEIEKKEEGAGKKFLDELLLKAIENREIDINDKLFQANKTAYKKLLQNLSNKTKWIKKNEGNKWVIEEKEKFTGWVIKESEKLTKKKPDKNSKRVKFHLSDDDIRE